MTFELARLAHVCWLAAGLAATPVEMTVERLADGRIVDLDNDPLGVAIINSSPGWEFSTDNRATWKSIDSRPLLLDFPSLIRMPASQPIPGERSPWIEYRAWDQTQGRNGEVIEISETGGTSAFSTNSLQVVFSAADATVDEDMKLSVGVKALSAGNNLAILSDVTYTVTPASMGAWQTRAATDDPKVAGYFVPSGQLGVAVLTVSGKNKRGQVVTSPPMTIEVIPGAAVRIVVESLGEVAR